MAYDALSSEQQELLDLLRNELADYVDDEPPELWAAASTWQPYFNHLGSQLEHLIRAVQMVGLTGFAASCEYLLQQFRVLSDLAEPPSVEAQAHISHWPVAFLGYLQQVLAKGFTSEAAAQLVDYLAYNGWPEPLIGEQREALLQAFEGSNVIVDEQATAITPDQITSEQASLSIPRDVRPELLDGLIAELPNQAESFSAAIEHYTHTNDGSYLLTAQRVAHTVKGAANVVGIVGMANLMHYCEDLLEAHQKRGAVSGEGFADLLLDAADCLANISDSLQGFGPAPDNVLPILVQLLTALRGDPVAATLTVSQEPPVLDQIHSETLAEQVPAGDLLGIAGAVSESDDFDGTNDFSEIDALLAADALVDDAPVNTPEVSATHPLEAPQSPKLANIDNSQQILPSAQEHQQTDAPAADERIAAEWMVAERIVAEPIGVETAESAAAKSDIATNDLALSEDVEAGPADNTRESLVADEQNTADALSEKSDAIDELDNDASVEDLFGADLAAIALQAADLQALNEAATLADSEMLEQAKLGPDADTDTDLIAPSQPEAITEQAAALASAEDAPGAEADTAPASAQPTAPSAKHRANDDAKAQFNLTIPDEKATELLRITGEIQIANTQMLARTDTAHQVLKAALRFQSQLIELANDFEKQLAKESAAKIAAGREGDVAMDPLELERYNELHSFASRLQEVAMDSQEAVRDADDTMLDLKAIAEDQRQMGFDMQNQVLGVRMLPAGVMSSRFARAVRQASRLIGKPAKFVFEGDDVLVDSRVLHGIADPILHLLRNAVDHGLEPTSADRLAKDKVAEGCVRVSFERVGESVRIQVSDDGLGLDYQRIKQLGIERGLLDADKSYSPTELQQIILLPGFSTRKQVTQTSGRGIGLDVVNDQVRQLKGQLQIVSDAGTGTQFVISVPMSVMSAHLLLVRSGGRMVGVVSRGLAQIAYLQKGDLTQNSQGQWQYTLADSDIDVLGFDDITQVADACPIADCAALLITQKADGSQCGVAVESIRASEEHVVKPLSRWAYRAEGVTGAAILGNGEVVAVVDIHDLPALRYSSQQFELWLSQQTVHRAALPVAAKPVALVVDDSLSARRALAQFMADAGYEVISARDGFDAIKAIEDTVPDIALVDLEMPRMNGLELAAHMRSQARLKLVPVVMVTSRTTARHKLLAESAGVDCYLNKPWSDDELTEALMAMSDSARQRVVGG